MHFLCMKGLGIDAYFFIYGDNMGIIELVLISLSLSMDAFAVSMCKGLEMTEFRKKNAFFIAFFFGLFQAMMPLIGYLIGVNFEHLITNVDHFIAFGLLLIIGGKMVYDSFFEKDEITKKEKSINLKQILILAVATSIDALAVGVGFAFIKMNNIYLAITLIGVITFLLSFIGVFIGNKIGLKFKNKAQLFGGIVLILLGTKILLEHLGVI